MWMKEKIHILLNLKNLFLHLSNKNFMRKTN